MNNYNIEDIIKRLEILNKKKKDLLKVDNTNKKLYLKNKTKVVDNGNRITEINMINFTRSIKF
tara:strand:+ start:261 stop:449 length:189 start_codon:yes stop_codon:yes gene_type:complete